MRARTCGPLIAAMVLGLLLPALAAAGQWPHERDGVLLGLNLGGGSAGVTVDSFDSDRETGAAASGRIAYAFDPQWAVGLEGNVWTKKVDNQTWTFSVGGVAATFYPGGSGFFVRGGIGSGRVELEVDTGSVQVTASDNGFGFLVGAGYEWRLTRKFALGPEISYAYADIADGFTLNYINTTVGLNWYF